MYIPDNGAGDFELPPPGTHLAICFGVVDLGTQQTTFQGQPKFQRKIAIFWELPNERTSQGEIMSIRNRYTLSGNKKAELRKHLESWRGVPFDDDRDFGPNGRFKIENIIGAPCLLNIVHSQDGQYANVTGVMKAMKGTMVPKMTNPKRYLSLNPGEFDRAAFDALPEGLRKTIEKSPEYAQLTGRGVNGGSARGNGAQNGQAQPRQQQAGQRSPRTIQDMRNDWRDDPYQGNGANHENSHVGDDWSSNGGDEIPF